MNLRQRMLLLFSAVVVVAVLCVSWIVSIRARKAFEEVDQQRTAALVTQFRADFDRQGIAISNALFRIANNERTQKIAFDSAHGADTSPYVRDAAAMAKEHQLEFLDFISSDGTIISSSEWPAHFGYKVPISDDSKGGTSLNWVELPTGKVPGLVSIYPIRFADGGVMYVFGGKRLDRGFLLSFSLPVGSYLWLYQVNGTELRQANLYGDFPVKIAALTTLLNAAQNGNETSGAVQLSADRLDKATVQAIPLKTDAGAVSSVLLVGTSRMPLLELEENIRAAAFGIAGLGILLAIMATLWVTAFFSRPVEVLATAARNVAAGDWTTRVPVTSTDELGQLAKAFNSMTHDLVEQRGKLLQTERVAAWRELARRLAHELKNPLFPLQITVENLVRARESAPEQFDEVFRESTTTLLAELNNLKTIIGRFSDFSKMPRPQLQKVLLNDVVNRVISLHRAQIEKHPTLITVRADLAQPGPELQADPDLLHRAFSNLILNAVDAMPDGGTMVIRTRSDGDYARFEISDTGAGLTPEERDRLFTPYYTTKQHGTGLGLAVVQSVVSDHHGTISVTGEQGRGTTFTILLPKEAPPQEFTAPQPPEAPKDKETAPVKRADPVPPPPVEAAPADAPLELKDSDADDLLGIKDKERR
jgi:two-component system nitrogen regulation sensor histidine kinase NtrY